MPHVDSSFSFFVCSCFSLVLHFLMLTSIVFFFFCCSLACLLFVTIDDQRDKDLEFDFSRFNMNLHNDKELNDLLDISAVCFIKSGIDRAFCFPRLNIERVFRIIWTIHQYDLLYPYESTGFLFHKHRDFYLDVTLNCSLSQWTFRRNLSRHQ
mgnify:CR=1 FL=1